MGILLTDIDASRRHTNQAVEQLGCFSCGAIGVNLNKIGEGNNDTVNPNAYLCDKCFKRYVVNKILNVGQEADRLLTLPVKRVGSCGHCGKELYTVGPQGIPPIMCNDCFHEFKKLQHKIRAEKEKSA
jgi:hypothetical protein